jgi:hypothetical protein
LVAADKAKIDVLATEQRSYDSVLSVINVPLGLETLPAPLPQDLGYKSILSICTVVDGTMGKEEIIRSFPEPTAYSLKDVKDNIPAVFLHSNSSYMGGKVLLQGVVLSGDNLQLHLSGEGGTTPFDIVTESEIVTVVSDILNSVYEGRQIP